MKKSDKPLTREQIIWLWKTEGGSYSWKKWAAMFEIPETDPGFINGLLESLKKNPLQKRKT